MKDYLITKEEIITAAADLIQQTYCPLYSPDERRGIALCFSALSEFTPEGSPLSELFRICAKSIPIKRNASIYVNNLKMFELNLRELEK